MAFECTDISHLVGCVNSLRFFAPIVCPHHHTTGNINATYPLFVINLDLQLFYEFQETYIHTFCISTLLSYSYCSG